MKTTIHTIGLKAKLAQGVGQVADLVKITMGPMGKKVIIEKGLLSPIVTMDGVTVADFICPKDHENRIGAELCKVAAKKTNAAAGDGTTTAIVLLNAMVQEGLKLLTAGYEAVDLKKGLALGLEAACSYLEGLAIPANTPERILAAASISAKDAKLGALIVNAMGQVGKDGMVLVQSGLQKETVVEVMAGIEVKKGFYTPDLVPKGERLHLELKDVQVFLTDGVLEDVAIAEKIVNLCRWENKNLLLIAKEFSRAVLAYLIRFNGSDPLQAVAVQAPHFGEERLYALEDIGVATGATVFSTVLGTSFKDLNPKHLGFAKKVTVNDHKTIIAHGEGSAPLVQKRIESLKYVLAKEREKQEQERLRQRIACLSGGVAVIRAGGSTEAEMKEVKYRLQDAVNAARAAVVGGILPGGGAAFLGASVAVEALQQKAEGVQAGIGLVAKSLKQPMSQINQNGGGDSKKIIKAVLEQANPWVGYDAENSCLVDLLKAGIVDPCLVCTTALRNAASIGGLIFTAEVLVGKEAKEMPWFMQKSWDGVMTEARLNNSFSD